MSKKTNKTCKLEQVNTTPNSNKTPSDILIIETKAQPLKPNPPSSLTKTQKVSSSPRMTPNNSTTLNVTAEKRGE
jgi:hypothetical protein